MPGKWLGWIAAAALSAYACAMVVQFGTPIDRALPAIAVIVTIVAAITYPAIAVAVPLLIAVEIAIPDERLRLLSFGVVLACVFALALTACHFERSEKPGRARAALLTTLAAVLLRWIPIQNVTIWREVLLIAIAIAIVYALHETPLAIAIATATALFTPLIPLRTIVPAILVLLIAILIRPKLNATIPASFAVALMLLFFAWSGVFARATSLAIRGLPSTTARIPMRMALAPGQSITLDVPSDAAALIVSGANIARLKPGALVGAIDRTPLRVGDVADWGFLRREHFYGSRNKLPHNAAGEVRDYGQAAWIDGAARFPLTQPRIVVRADAHLPANARLQIESFELRSR